MDVNSDFRRSLRNWDEAMELLTSNGTQREARAVFFQQPNKRALVDLAKRACDFLVER